jgi:hypothetical protein
MHTKTPEQRLQVAYDRISLLEGTIQSQLAAAQRIDSGLKLFLTNSALSLTAEDRNNLESISATATSLVESVANLTPVSASAEVKRSNQEEKFT